MMSNDTDVDLKKDIFDALIEKHEVQRALCDKLEKTEGEAQRKAVYEDLKLELQAHAAAEERHLYQSNERGLHPTLGWR